MSQWNKNIILIGMAGSGKTAVGQALSKKLGWTFLDTDALLEEEAGCDISTIFEQEGESGFRKRERRIIHGLGSTNLAVIATGGGAVMEPSNRMVLSELGAIVWLKANQDTLVNRLRSDQTRPLLAGGDLSEKIQAILDLRSETYEALADFVVDVDGQSVPEIINLIKKKGL